MRLRTDLSIARHRCGVLLALCASWPLHAQEAGRTGTGLTGTVKSLPGPCQARDAQEGPWRDLAPGAALSAGTTIVCQQDGRLAYTLPVSGIEVARDVRRGEEVVVARGRLTPTPVEGSRPGLRAGLAPRGAAPDDPMLAKLPSRLGPRSPASPDYDNAVLASGAFGALLGSVTSQRLAVAGAKMGSAASSASPGAYLADLRTKVANDDNSVAALVSADVRKDNVRLSTATQTAGQWIDEIKRAGTPGPDAAASAPSADERKLRDARRLSALADLLQSAQKAAEGYEDVASRLQVADDARRSLDAELGGLRVGVRQLGHRITEFRQQAARIDAVRDIVATPP